MCTFTFEDRGARNQNTVLQYNHGAFIPACFRALEGFSCAVSESGIAASVFASHRHRTDIHHRVVGGGSTRVRCSEPMATTYP